MTAETSPAGTRVRRIARGVPHRVQLYSRLIFRKLLASRVRDSEVALLVIACMFIGVCYHAYNVYSEIHTGRKTWGEFGLSVSVGAVLLVVGIWLLTQATTIL